jgi:E3 ubiquitin-protein ligase BAH
LYLGEEFSVNAALSPDTRAYLEKLTMKHGSPLNGNTIGGQIDGLEERGETDLQPSPRKTSSSSEGAVIRIDVPLTSDAEFFDMLQGNVKNLESLQALEEQSLTNEIVELSRELASLSQPKTKFYRRTDMYRWREL